MKVILCVVGAIVPGLSVAQVASVDAQLSFVVWKVGVSKGVQMAGGKPSKQLDEPVHGELFLKVGEEYVKVNYREGRRSPVYQYSGPAQCVFYEREQAPAEDGGAVEYKPLAKVQLLGSGKYLVVLKSKVGKPAPLKPLLLPYSDDFLAEGMLCVVNDTDREVVVVPDNRKIKLPLKPRAMGKMKLENADATGIYLQVYSRKSADAAWKIESSNAYAVYKHSKHACILYQDRPRGDVRVKLYSGLGRTDK